VFSIVSHPCWQSKAANVDIFEGKESFAALVPFAIPGLI
jgi:hypothetical protein